MAALRACLTACHPVHSQAINIGLKCADGMGICRDHPEKKIDFTVSRNNEIIHVPVTPTLSADGTGRIGVSLAVNAKIVRKAANGIVDAGRLAGIEFSRLTGIVVGGKHSQTHLRCTLQSDTAYMLSLLHESLRPSCHCDIGC